MTLTNSIGPLNSRFVGRTFYPEEKVNLLNSQQRKPPRRNFDRIRDETKRIQSSLDAFNSGILHAVNNGGPCAQEPGSSRFANLIGPGSNPLVRLSSNIDDVSASRLRTPLVALSRYDRHFGSSTRSRRQSRPSLTHLAGLPCIDSLRSLSVE